VDGNAKTRTSPSKTFVQSVQLDPRDPRRPQVLQLQQMLKQSTSETLLEQLGQKSLLKQQQQQNVQA